VEPARNNLLEALKQVEQDTDGSALGWRLLLYGMVLLPTIFVVTAPGLLLQDHVEHPFLDIRVWMILDFAILLLGLSFTYEAHTRKAVQKELECSSIAARIASGELVEDEIFSLTPWPWQRLLPGSAVNPSLHLIIRRVCLNLDWYLNPPRKLWRFGWIYKPVMSALAIWFFGVILLAVLVLWWISYWLPPAVLNFIALPFKLHPLFWAGADAFTVTRNWAFCILALMIPLPLVHFRRQVWTDELIKHLRLRMEN
jgi:hypothetical protein